MRALLTYIWLPALCGMAAVQGCSATSAPGGSGSIGGFQSSAGTVGVAGTSAASGGSNTIGTGGTSSSGGAPDTSGGGRHGGKGGRSGSGGDGGASDSGGSSAGGSNGVAGGGGQTASGGSGGSDSGKPIGQFVMTWYSFQDNTPVNSLFSASGNLLTPYVSVAVPFTQLKGCAGIKPKTGTCTGTLSYGDKLYIEFLKDRVMPNGMKHTGWVELGDYCGDAMDDTYCYQKVGGMKYPNIDLYIGDFTKSGMGPSNGDCTGPAGNGQELTNVAIGNPGASFINNYGGAAVGTGKCGDQQAARDQQFGPPASAKRGTTTDCWGYDDQDSAGDCSMCMPGITCAK